MGFILPVRVTCYFLICKKQLLPCELVAMAVAVAAAVLKQALSLSFYLVLLLQLQPKLLNLVENPSVLANLSSRVMVKYCA